MTIIFKLIHYLISDKYIQPDLKFLQTFFEKNAKKKEFKKQLNNVLGFSPGDVSLYKTALSHRSVREGADENNERLEFLGDAVLSSIIAHYLFKKYPYKGEGFLTEMRSKMVNRQKLNEIALKMGLKKITFYNKFDNALKISQIFGNTLEALIGAVFLDKGYRKTQRWVEEYIIFPHLFTDDLEGIEINIKNKLYGWANKNGKALEFETLDEKIENGRRLFTIGATVDGELVSQAKGYNKKDASQIAAQMAVEKLGL
ncbi:MAG: ribonuclease III [Ferruginibacter sp.]|nr:ribonuclease III [Ferruginibacter sp.]